MALYRYQALTKDGKKVTGVLDAPSQQHVKEHLGRQGLFPITIAQAQEGVQEVSSWRSWFTKKVTIKEKILFTKQLAVLLKSGVPLLQALELLLEQFEGALHRMLVRVKDDVKEGLSLADALKKYPDVFDNIYVQLVRAGEASGKLEVILVRLMDSMERQEELSKKIKGALFMPMVQLVIAALVIVGMLTFVVPKIADTFANTGKKLPGLTVAMMAISNFLINHYLLLLGSIVSIIALYNWWSRTPAGARRLDEIKLKIPMVKYFAKTGAVAQFARTFGMLEESGVNLSESLDIVVSIMKNRILADTLNQARDNIIKQGKIAQYLKETKLFPPLAIYLIKTGEETGQLGYMLLTIAENQEEELGEYADTLTSLISPVMAIVMGIIVCLIVLAIALPLQQMSDIGM